MMMNIFPQSVHLTEEFDMKYPNIDIICLPDFKGENFDSTDCVTMGWGKDASRRKYPFYQKLLKQVNLNIVDHETCQTGLRTTRLKNDFILHKSMICAGGEEGKDACEGDGGGPLVCKAHDSDRYKTRFFSWLGNFINIARGSATRSKNSQEKWQLSNCL